MFIKLHTQVEKACLRQVLRPLRHCLRPVAEGQEPGLLVGEVRVLRTQGRDDVIRVPPLWLSIWEKERF